MKKIVLLTSALLAFAYVHAQSWIMQASAFSNVGDYPFAIHVSDSLVAWCVSFAGDGSNQGRQEFSMTTDGGNTWSPGIIESDTNYRCSGVWAYDADTAYVL